MSPSIRFSKIFVIENIDGARNWRLTYSTYFLTHPERLIMTIKLQLNTISIAIALSLGTIVSAHAAGSREAEALDKATIQLVQATQIAEKQESGKTIKAEFDSSFLMF